MTATLATARDEIYALFNVTWVAETPPITTTVPPIAWEGVPFTPPTAAPWAAITIRHTAGGQATLTGGLGDGVRFNKVGTINIAVWTPNEAGEGVAVAEQLALVAKKAFEGQATASQVWFRDVVAREVGPDGPWFQWNVTASFTYDELVA